MSYTCLARILQSNTQLTDYYNQVHVMDARNSTTNNINMFSQDNEDSFKKKLYWNNFLGWTKKIILILLLTSTLAVGGVHVLPHLHEHVLKVGETIIKASESVKQQEEMFDKIGETLKEVHEEDVKLTNEELLKNNTRNTLSNIIQKLAKYDLMIEMYRTNLIIVTAFLDKSELEEDGPPPQEGVVTTEEVNIIKILHKITIDQFYKTIIECYKCVGLNVTRDEVLNVTSNEEPSHIQDDSYDFLPNVQRRHFNIPWYKKTFSFFKKKKQDIDVDERELSSNCLFAIITEYEKMEQKISPIIMKLNSYITRLNMLVNINECMDDAPVIYSFKPVFGSLIGMLIKKINNEKKGGDSQVEVEEVTQYITGQDLNGREVITDNGLLQILETIQTNCDYHRTGEGSRIGYVFTPMVTPAIDPITNLPEIDAHSRTPKEIVQCIDRLKKNKDGEMVLRGEWDIDDIYKEILYNTHTEAAIHELVSGESRKKGGRFAAKNVCDEITEKGSYWHKECNDVASNPEMVVDETLSYNDNNGVIIKKIKSSDFVKSVMKHVNDKLNLHGGGGRKSKIMKCNQNESKKYRKKKNYSKKKKKRNKKKRSK